MRTVGGIVCAVFLVCSTRALPAVASTPAADVSVKIDDDPDPIVVNDDLTYTITVRNAGPDTATNVRLTDSASKVTLSSVFATQGRCTSGAETCDLGSLEPGGEAVVSLIVQPLVIGRLSDVVEVEADGSDRRPSNNVARAVTTVKPARFDLSTSLDALPNPVRIGGDLVYSADIANAGPNAAWEVVATFDVAYPDDGPGAMIFRSGSPGCVADPSSGPEIEVTCRVDMIGGDDTERVELHVMPLLPTPALRGSVGVVAKSSLNPANERDTNTRNNNAKTSSAVSL